MTAADHATRSAIVIGGGWAGCACAATLASRGAAVTLLEAARTLGGRARRLELDGRVLDNGQHILLGAYGETWRLLSLLGVAGDAAGLLRLPLQMRYPPASGGMDFLAPQLPAPWHLLLALWRARGLSRADKLALARFSLQARLNGWRLDTDCSVADVLARWRQTPRLTALLWRPLCIAALNTEPGRASAQVFLNVLRDSLGARRAASDMLIPTVDLSALLPQRAADFLARRGGTLHYGMAARSITRIDKRIDKRGEVHGEVQDEVHDGQRARGHAATRWRVATANASFEADTVVIATGSEPAATLLATSAEPLLAPLCATLRGLQHEAIATCYLQYDRRLRLAQPFYALLDDGAAGRWGQFVFDRGQLDAAQAGLLAVVVSASNQACALPQAELSSAIARQLAQVFERPELAQPQWSRVIAEKRATFSCTPGLLRPPNASPLAGLLLAGDYTAADYPATLEAAVASGVKAAELALAAT